MKSLLPTLSIIFIFILHPFIFQSENVVRYSYYYYIFTFLFTIIVSLLYGIEMLTIKWNCEKKINTVVLHGYLEIMTVDFNSAPVNFQTAIKMAEKRGNGWRIPTKYELELLYKNKDLIGGLNHQLYFFDICHTIGGTIDFQNGTSVHGALSNSFGWIRFVRYVDKDISYYESAEEVGKLTRHI